MFEGAGRPSVFCVPFRRIRLMQTLERAGVPLEEVAATIRRGDLSLDFMDRPTTGG